jgi:AraC-like DNA-binding protein
MFLEYRPAPPLSSYVEKLWYCEGYRAAHRQERVLPNGRFQIVIDLAQGFTGEGDRGAASQLASPSLVIGMRSRYSVIDTAGLQSIMGVVFWPGGARGFFDVPADEFYNQVVPLDWVWGSAVTALRDRLRDTFSPAEKFRVLETTLRRRAGKRLELHSAVRYALGEFRRVPHTRSVLDVTRHAGLSRRRFAQSFREQVGLTPKLYCRLRRFRQVVGQIASGAPVDWVDVALAGGY